MGVRCSAVDQQVPARPAIVPPWGPENLIHEIPVCSRGCFVLPSRPLATRLELVKASCEWASSVRENFQDGGSKPSSRAIRSISSKGVWISVQLIHQLFGDCKVSLMNRRNAVHPIRPGTRSRTAQFGCLPNSHLDQFAEWRTDTSKNQNRGPRKCFREVSSHHVELVRRANLCTLHDEKTCRLHIWNSWN